MTSEVNLISVREIADRVMSHPLMTDLSLEAIVRYTVDFIGKIGAPYMFMDKQETIAINNYRAALPCDLISIKQVKNTTSGVSMRSTTDTFYSDNKSGEHFESTFKVQGRVIYTSFKCGKITIVYTAMALDKDGFPMIPDNSTFLTALELYVKKKWFTILFDMGKISPAVLQNVQQEYSWEVGQLNSEMSIPSISEMESISNIFNQLIPRTNEFRKGFKNLGDREYLKLQR